MAMEHQIVPSPGARKGTQRVGRGDGSRRGNYSGRGIKGAGSRAGSGPRPGFEGGQVPLIKRMPALRGFITRNRIEYAVVNVEQLDGHFDASSEVTGEALAALGLIRKAGATIKILGNGEITKALTVHAHKFTEAAKQKIEAAGGTAEEVA